MESEEDEAIPAMDSTIRGGQALLIVAEGFGAIDGSTSVANQP